MEKNYALIMKYAKKIQAIEFLGGKCQKCGETDIFKLCFHHKDSDTKEALISKLLKSKWENLEKELIKCELMCINCHCELHFKDLDNSLNRNKKIYLEFKNFDGCEICGYNKSEGAIHFHHKSDKEFKISKYTKRLHSLNELRIEIIGELNKCEIICGNCHNKKHSDVKFFNENKEKIYNKIKEIGKYKNHDYEKIIEAYLSGMKSKEIQIKFNCPRSTLSDMLERYGVKKQKLKINKEEILKMHNSGYKNKEISKELGIKYYTVKSVIYIHNKTK